MADIGLRLERDLHELVARAQRVITERIPELPSEGQPLEMLAASIQGNYETLAVALRYDLDVNDIAIPSAAREYARRLAQHAVSSNALARAYRLGQQVALDWVLERVAEQDARPGPEGARRALGTARELMDLTFGYVDTIAEQVLEEYDAERERWQTLLTSERSEIIDRLLAGDPVDPRQIDRRLGYRVEQLHQAAVIWAAEDTLSAVDLETRAQALSHLGQTLGTKEIPLLWPKDRVTAWVWLPLGRDTDHPGHDDLDALLTTLPPTVRIALGTPADGAAGFRASHREALLAQRVAQTGRAPDRAVSFATPGVRAASLLLSDLDAARRLVTATLGPLAADTESAARLRETLLTFLREKDSYVATARRLHLHANTGKHRISKANAAAPSRAGANRFDLELALVACQWLGPVVLTADQTTRSDVNPVGRPVRR